MQQKGGSTNQKQGQPKKKPCYSCGAEPSHPRSEYPANKVICYKCGNEEHYSSVCRSKGKNFKVIEVQAQPAAQYQNCIPEKVHSSVSQCWWPPLKTATAKSLNNPRPESKIRPLWLSKELLSQICCLYCEVDTGASCYILPLYKVKAVFRENIQLGLPIVKLIDYSDIPVKNLGSITVFL